MKRESKRKRMKRKNEIYREKIKESVRERQIVNGTC